MAKSFESKTFRASPVSESLKTTIPQSVATVLGVEAGDTLTWTVDVASREATVSRLATAADLERGDKKSSR